MKITYTEKYVAFLDILGFSSQIETSVEDDAVREKIGDALKRFYLIREQLAQNPAPSYGYGIESVHSFSDCVVVCANTDYKGLSSMIFLLYQAWGYLLFLGFLCRGAVVRGAIFSDERRVFGPALNRAYRLETEQADFPRIIFDKRLVTDCTEMEKTEGICGTDQELSPAMRLDSDDGWHYLDVFRINPILAQPGVGLQNAPLSDLVGLKEFLEISNVQESTSRKRWFKMLEEKINEALERAQGSSKEYKKCLWLMERFLEAQSELSP